MQRKYVRENSTSRETKHFYESFKTWIMTQYPSNGQPTEEEWEEIMEADALNYKVHDTDEVVVTHEETDSDELNVDLPNEATMYNTLTYNIA